MNDAPRLGWRPIRGPHRHLGLAPERRRSYLVGSDRDRSYVANTRESR